MVTLSIYFIAALGPAAALLYYIYKQDKVEKEPPALLWKLVGFGALSGLAAMQLEGIADPFLAAAYDPATEPVGYTVLSAFIGVALMEEGAKYFFLRLGSWHDPNFNYRFDGIVYAVCVSLGFAALENLLYVLGYGLEIAPWRAVLSIPGHMSFAVLMGYFYSRARLMSNWGDVRRSARYRRLAVISATLSHGFYDCCLMLGTNAALAVFLIFVAAMFLFVFRLVRRESRQDAPI